MSWICGYGARAEGPRGGRKEAQKKRQGAEAAFQGAYKRRERCEEPRQVWPQKAQKGRQAEGALQGATRRRGRCEAGIYFCAFCAFLRPLIPVFFVPSVLFVAIHSVRFCGPAFFLSSSVPHSHRTRGLWRALRLFAAHPLHLFCAFCAFCGHLLRPILWAGLLPEFPAFHIRSGLGFLRRLCCLRARLAHPQRGGHRRNYAELTDR